MSAMFRHRDARRAKLQLGAEAQSPCSAEFQDDRGLQGEALSSYGVLGSGAAEAAFCAGVESDPTLGYGVGVGSLGLAAFK